MIKTNTHRKTNENTNTKTNHKKFQCLSMYIGCNAVWLMTFVHLKIKTKAQTKTKTNTNMTI